jgi:hypothetical protein
MPSNLKQEYKTTTGNSWWNRGIIVAKKGLASAFHQQVTI